MKTTINTINVGQKVELTKCKHSWLNGVKGVVIEADVKTDTYTVKIDAKYKKIAIFDKSKCGIKNLIKL